MHDTKEMVAPSSADNANDLRRSSRVFTRIPIKVAGRNVGGKKFHDVGQTIVVNAHGGLLYLNHELAMGAEIVLANPVTEEEQECRVVFLGEASEKGQRIGVEFLSPAPHFWGFDFAPSDWPSKTPSISAK
ncbi:MAG: hypothetical protein ACRD50_09410 [Candidatus Acidiferrales bacterium]